MGVFDETRHPKSSIYRSSYCDFGTVYGGQCCSLLWTYHFLLTVVYQVVTHFSIKY